MLIKTNHDYYVKNNIRYVFLDGNLCNTLADCYKTLKQQLSLPEYFGNNLDSLDEMLSDLDWIEEEQVKIIVLNSFFILKEEAQKKESFFAVLNENENDMLGIIYLGKM